MQRMSVDDGDDARSLPDLHFPSLRHILSTLDASTDARLTPAATCAESVSYREEWPQAQPEGIETASSRFASDFHLPRGVRSWLASSLRAC